MFVTPRSTPRYPKEGDNFLYRCLLTDPSVTDLTLQSEGEDRGRGLPPGMNVTLDPRKGALIKHIRKTFKGRYSCSGWRNGQEFRSEPFALMVAPSKTPVSLHTCRTLHLSVYLSDAPESLPHPLPVCLQWTALPPSLSARVSVSVYKENGSQSPVRAATLHTATPSPGPTHTQR